MSAARSRLHGARRLLASPAGSPRGLALAAAGTAVGLLGAIAANRLLAAMLFEVSPTDVPTLGVVALALLLGALVASCVPARSGTRIDPVVALRAE